MVDIHEVPGSNPGTPIYIERAKRVEMLRQQKDHKEIGRKLELFYLSPENPGMVFWYPKGTILYNLIVDDLRKRLSELGYQEVKTPHILNIELWKKSGHWDNFKDKMFFTGNDPQIRKSNPKWAVKPMNCPGTILLYSSQMRSYRDLPLYFSEIGTVYRYEQPGEVSGLFRTRGFDIDDAHIFCRENQIEEEIGKIIDLIKETYKKYGFLDFDIELSTKPKKSIGTNKQWEGAENSLRVALKSKKITFVEKPGEGAFYGPKIDFHIKDSLKRSWQLSTVQLDFATAERFGAVYIDEKGKKQIPVLIHRAILGSIERFIAILLEHTGGALPFWLSPVQVYVLPIASRHLKYAQKVGDRIRESGFRVEIDERNETLDKKIRDAEILKIPYIIVVGDREIKTKKVALRSRKKGDEGQISLKDLLTKIS